MNYELKITKMKKHTFCRRLSMIFVLEYTLREGGAPHAFCSLLGTLVYHTSGSNFALRAKFLHISVRSVSVV